MKKKVKLSLNKLTISNLEQLKPSAKAKVVGGVGTREWYGCNTDEQGCLYDTEWRCETVWHC